MYSPIAGNNKLTGLRIKLLKFSYVLITFKISPTSVPTSDTLRSSPRNSLSVSCGADVLATDSLSFLFPGNVIISPLFLKNTFTEHRILEGDSFFLLFQNLKYFYFTIILGRKMISLAMGTWSDQLSSFPCTVLWHLPSLLRSELPV